MADRKRSSMRTDAALETQRLAAVLGSEARSARRRRRRTQAQVSAAAGMSRSRYAELEVGAGATAPLDVWVRVGLALGRLLSVAFSRDIDPGPADAGHLAAQELVLRLAGGVGRRVGAFELPTRPSDPSRQTSPCTTTPVAS
jgi:transcriptional regulator with XRE-family HTH domain